ncbi:helix-turn-helix domain-containing protein [Luteolibacter flavescens]|uniref:Helix-turn-helix domain-containing protein n=1 Tax=Luteolibacter flavescens TaxID=1859460 RepID=A0ABT3FQG3_9BACT|nr:helix-turn-helix domain-containing protein [Luteolibacter flavescens]MCW1885471.1 helix-turn-helix domain-containing protein [Luteolibacter flavescens]
MKRITVILSDADERTILRMKGVGDFFLGAAGYQVDYRMADSSPPLAGETDGMIFLGRPCGAPPPGVPVVGVGEEFHAREVAVCRIREDAGAAGMAAGDLLARQGVARAVMISSGRAGDLAMWKSFQRAIARWDLPCHHHELSDPARGLPGQVRDLLMSGRCGVLLTSPLLALPLHEVRLAAKGSLWMTGSDAPGMAAALELTSGIESSRRMGWLAAACLVKAMRGDAVPPLLEVPPHGIAHRRSTYPFAGSGCAEVERALAFIRDAAERDIGVDDVARASGVSRSVLQRRVKETLHVSVLHLIQWHRIERVKTCLSDRSLGMEQISELTGFSSSAHMTEVFKKWTGNTPTEFRNQLKARP